MSFTRESSRLSVRPIIEVRIKTHSNYSLKLVLALLGSASYILAQTSTYNNGQLAAPPGAPMQRQSSPPQGSARPGSLNYLEGQVSANGQPLNLQAVGRFVLQPGQSLETGGNSFAEVLLTPGSFLRLGSNSEVRLTSAGLADTRISLTRGSALIEADQVISGSHLEVTIDTTSIDLEKKGLYGFAANPPDVKVFDGKANVISLQKHREIGKHDQVLLAGNDRIKKTSFDENQAKSDPLYVWSETRSREEAAQNKLVAQNPNGYTPVGGGWFWDPYANYYGFWPSAFLDSPFGFGFYGGYYPGFYGGYFGAYHRGGFWRGHPLVGGVRGFTGFHGNGVAGGFHGGGFHGGGFHAGGGGGGHR